MARSRERAPTAKDPTTEAPKIKPLALTSGEPAGIGPDIAIAAWLRRNELDLPPFYLLGDRAFFADRAKILGLQVELADAAPEEAQRGIRESVARGGDRRNRHRAPGTARRHQRGRCAGLHPPGGRRRRRGRASAVVTNPIAKSVLYRAGFRHPGHTEFLAELAADGGRAPQPVMMLWSPALAVVPVTIHLSLREAMAQLSSELIVTTARIAVADLKARFGLARPRLAISGLNPHAGEDGSLGSEDIDIVAPAIETLRTRRHRRPRPAAGRHHVPRRRAQDL